MAKKARRPRKRSSTVRRKKNRVFEINFRTAFALLLLASFVLLAVLAGKRAAKPASADGEKLEKLVTQVLARLSLEAAGLSWERLEGSSPTLVVVVNVPEAFPVDRLALDLEAALHNLGGTLEKLPVLEKGGYAKAAFRGRLGEAQLRVLLMGAFVEHSPKKSSMPPRSGFRELGKLSVVLDDAGYSEDVLPLIAQLPLEVAVAVLPNAPYSAAIAQRLRAEGRELLLHMPMEPQGNGASPGEGAIHVGLGENEVQKRLEEALEVVGPVLGVNNHMGSRATADPQLMKSFMQALQGKRLYFLDSRTTGASVAAEVAQQAGIPTLVRDVFLDVVGEEAALRSALATAAALARSRGKALAIGHVHPLTLKVLAVELPKLSGVRLVRPSQLLPKSLN